MKIILGVIGIMATLASCQKGEVISEEPTLTGTDAVKGALTNTDWVLKHTALIYNPDLADNAEPEACKMDDTYRYKPNGDADVQFGSSHCSSPLASGSYGSWDLQANGTIIKQTITRDVPGYVTGEVIIWTVDYITSKKLRIQRQVIETGKMYTQIDTYIRK